jgi:hypothetical protein
MRYTTFAVVLALALVSPRAAAALSSPLSVALEPLSLSGSGSIELLCTVIVPADAKTCTIEVQPPLGFRAEPRTITITGAAPGVQIVRRITLTPSDTFQKKGSKTVLVDLLATGPNGALPTGVSTQSKTFTYTNPRLDVVQYLWIGGFGIILGYIARFLINLLKTIPAPAPFVDATAAGRITTFVQKHYYWVDGGITLALGLLILIGFIRNELPPDAAAYWYGALILGVGVGALTNSELLTRLVAGLPRSGGVAVTRTV